MRLVFGLVLVLGLGLAGFAVYMAKNYINAYQTQLAKERSQRAPAIELADIYVANRPLKYGETILKKDVKLISFPQKHLPEGSFATEEALFPKGEDEPRKVLRTMEKNEPVLKVKVSGPGEEAGIASQLERGMRAFAIKVDVTSGVSGFLRPGDHVDVYWTGRVGGENVRTENDSTGEVTKLIETNVRLIAVDQQANQNTSGTTLARTVTVAVPPQQVAALAQAQATGRLTLSLVGALDDTISEVIEVDQRRLLGLTEAETAQEVAQQEICTIRTNRGGEVVVNQIPCTN
ncbi:Flp pilus assembly protein CpaB [Roseovarius sp. 2305UL8-3]|uniref:Flp pilus assembly protein CpaB n=1 Tax=Roseovarius conchicola TaxID=3121636 RepID=UPI003526DD9D